MKALGAHAAMDANEEISALIEVLDETNQRLEELTGGQIDAVADPKGRSFVLLRRTQEKLRRREAARQAAILNALPAHIALIDAQGRILSVNDAWRLFERENMQQGPGHATGQNYLQICLSAQGNGSSECGVVAAGIRKVLDGNTKSFSLEYARDTPVGSEQYLITVTPVAGEQSGGAVLMHQNITAEHQIKTRLSASELMFRQMAKSIDDVFFLSSLDASRIWYVSPAYEKIWGRHPEDLYTNPGSWMSSIHPDDRTAAGEITRGAIQTGSFEVEYRILRPDDTVRWIRARGFPVHNEQGELIRIAGVAMDITELHETACALQRTLADLSQSNRDLQDFAHVASHDLQEPLRKIMLFSDRLLAMESVSLHPQARSFAERNVDAARRMQILISSLLTFSEGASNTLPFAPVDLQRTLLDVVEDLSNLIERTNARVEVGELPTIEGDAAGLHQAFQNLIANALKFRREGVAPHITLSATEVVNLSGDAAWAVAVEDNGIGFEQKYAARIFTVFQRLHDRSEFEGAGIGLSIVRRVIQRHHGTIVATGHPGQGSRFELILPRQQPATNCP